MYTEYIQNVPNNPNYFDIRIDTFRIQYLILEMTP